MSIALRPITLPDFGTPLARPLIPAQTYAARAEAARAAAGADWLVVYADREHFANIVFLTGFEPRFEEALLLLGPKGERIIVAGNENMDYAPIAGLPDVSVRLCQALSLMAQDRSLKPNLAAVLRELGIGKGDSIGLAGWKYVVPEEWDGPKPTFFVPSYVVDSLALVAGAISDATHVLMHPTHGLRAVVDADQIAEAEWAATRASLAVWRIVSGFTLGDNELLAASRMGYAGEPMNCHPMFTTGDASRPVIGLKSPSARQAARGDGVTTAVSFWGGLTARAGLVCDHDEEFVAVASAYFKGLLAWYETADIGVEGGTIHEAVVSTLAAGGLRPALNPGHLTGHDEWMNSPICPGSSEKIASGMPFQIDIIPVPMPAGWALNCEDPVTFADAALKAEIAARHPEVAARFEARRAFVRDQIGVAVKENVLLLSAIPLVLPPLWLKKGYALTRG